MTDQTAAARGNEDVQELRIRAGRWLRELREAAGLSQRELAIAVGFDYYTFISQLESGRGKLPAAHYVAFASALNMPLRDFVKTLLRYYDTITYDALFGAADNDAATDARAGTAGGSGAANVEELEDRIARLEALIARK